MNFEQEMNGMERLCLPMCKRIINTDVSEDFTLPDYEPEIRRVLYVREALLPPARFISGNKLDVNGVIDYTVVYVSNEGRLCSAPLSAEYSFSLPLDGIGDFEMSEGVSIMAHSVAESSTVRVSSPRKLQIRSRLRTNVNAWGKKSCVESIEGLESPISLQRRMEEGLCADVVCESSDIVSLEDEYQLPSESCRVALADSAVLIEGCRVEGELVRIKGEVVLKLLVLCDDDGRSERVIRRLPFDAESDLDGIDASAEALCRATGNVTDLALNVEDGTVRIEANLVLEVCLAQNRGVSYTSDVYSTEQSVQTEMTDEELPFVLSNRGFNLSQSERIPLSELNFPENAEIVDASASACVDEVALEDGRYVIRGVCKYNLICVKDGEYSYCEAKAPFRYEMEGALEIDSFDACVEVFNCRARSDGEMLNLDAELCGACTLMGSNDITMLQSAVFSEARQRGKGEWTVCYVQNEDSIWNIAKRYGVRADEIRGNPERDRFVLIER